MIPSSMVASGAPIVPNLTPLKTRPFIPAGGRDPCRSFTGVAVAGLGVRGYGSTPMSVEAQIQERLKEAMRAKDARTADCIRMIKTKHMERRTAAGFKGPLDDNLWLDVIAAYQKQLRKSREEYVAIGERGADAVAQLDFEIGFCAQFLPKAASDDETRAIVRETVARLGVSDAKQAGRVVGDIMKAHKGKLEPATVKRFVEEELGAPKS
jgi:uncharacterized protein